MTTVILESRGRRAPESVLIASARITPKVLPVLPDAAKRLMSGGRAVVIDGNTLDPTLQAFTACLRLMGIKGVVTDDDVALSRRLMRAMCQGLGGSPVPVHVSERPIPGPGGEVRVRHYRPAEADADAPALVYFHGGGYVLGDLDGYDSLCRLLCRDAGVHVFSVDYRLAPEHPAPAAVDDCLTAFRWVTAHADEFGVRPDRVAVGGDSAGGGLAAVVAQSARDDDRPPVLQLLLYPWLDIRTHTRSRTLFAFGAVFGEHDNVWCGDRYLGESAVAADDPRVSPGRARDLSGVAPALVVTPGFDSLRDEGDAYAAALAAAGVPVDLRKMGSMTHGFMNFAGLGGGVAGCVAEVTSALRAHLRRG